MVFLGPQDIQKWANKNFWGEIHNAGKIRENVNKKVVYKKNRLFWTVYTIEERQTTTGLVFNIENGFGLCSRLPRPCVRPAPLHPPTPPPLPLVRTVRTARPLCCCRWRLPGHTPAARSSPTGQPWGSTSHSGSAARDGLGEDWKSSYVPRWSIIQSERPVTASWLPHFGYPLLEIGISNLGEYKKGQTPKLLTYFWRPTDQGDRQDPIFNKRNPRHTSG